MLLPILCTLLCFLAIYLYVARQQPGRLSRAIEDHVADVLRHVDDATVEEGEEEEAFYTPRMPRGRFQGKVVAIAKAEFGHLQRTEANRLMVRKFMRDFMRERGMRPTHIAQHLDVSVACFFIPSDQDILAHQVGATREAHTRDGLINTLWESYFGPLGRMLGFSRE